MNSCDFGKCYRELAVLLVQLVLRSLLERKRANVGLVQRQSSLHSVVAQG